MGIRCITDMRNSERKITAVPKTWAYKDVKQHHQTDMKLCKVMRSCGTWSKSKIDGLERKGALMQYYFDIVLITGSKLGSKLWWCQTVKSYKKLFSTRTQRYQLLTMMWLLCLMAVFRTHTALQNPLQTTNPICIKRTKTWTTFWTTKHRVVHCRGVRKK